jgi:hypothetical protein
MRIATGDREIAAGLMPHNQPRRGVGRALVERAPLARKVVAEAVGEAGEVRAEIPQILPDGRGIAAGSQRQAEAWIVPPCGMEALRKQLIWEGMVVRELSTTAARTRASTPARRSAPVRCAASAIAGSCCGVTIGSRP